MLGPWLREFTTKDTKTKELKPLPHAKDAKHERGGKNKTQWSNAILGDSFLHMTLNREYRKRFST